MEISFGKKALLATVFLIGILLLFVYSFGVSKWVFGGDSGDIILSYFFAGVPHPPGYPLNTMLGVILTRIIPGVSFAYRANFVSAIYNACAISLIFYLISRLTKNTFIALAAALVLAFTPLFWLYAHFAEVFQLSLVLVSLSFIFLFEWYLGSGKRSQPRFLYISIFFFGLAVFHHNTILLLAPAYLYLLLKRKKEVFNWSKLLRLAAFFLAGLLPYFYVIWAAFRHTPINWDDPSTPANLLRLVTRADYGSFSATPELVGIALDARLRQLVWYFLLIRADFTVFGLLLIALGFTYLFIKKRDWFWFLALAVFFSGPFFLFYASFPLVDPFLQGISERFLLLNYLILAIILAFGMLSFAGLIVKGVNRLGFRRRILVLFFSAVFLLFPLVLASINFPKSDLSGFSAGKTLGDDVLRSADAGGIIFLQGDTVTFTSQYSYYVDRVNPSTKIIMTGRLIYPSYRQQVIRQYPELSYGDKFKSPDVIALSDAVLGIIHNNFDKFPIYILEQVPLDDNKIWVQEGALLRLYKPENAPSASDLVSIINSKVGSFTFKPDIFSDQYASFFTDHFKSIYARIFVRNGFALLSQNKSAEALPYFAKVLEFENDDLDARYGMGVSFLDTGNCQSADAALEQVVKLDPTYAQGWMALGKVWGDCLGNKEKGDEYAKKALLLQEKSLGAPIN